MRPTQHNSDRVLLVLALPQRLDDVIRLLELLRQPLHLLRFLREGAAQVLQLALEDIFLAEDGLSAGGSAAAAPMRLARIHAPGIVGIAVVLVVCGGKGRGRGAGLTGNRQAEARRPL